VDGAGLLSSSGVSATTKLLERLNASGKVQMAVLIAPSLEGLDIESYALQVADAWRLGKKGTDDGLLLVIAPNERRMRFEVGYGLEGVLTDIATKRILSDELAPYFRQKRYADGIQVAIDAVARALEIDVVSSVERLRTKENSTKLSPIAILFFLFLILIFLALFGSGGGWRGHSGWGPPGGGGFGGHGGFGGGGFGGGGFGGGGGGFGGGGSSSSW
jgi:uncharacterized protein